MVTINPSHAHFVDVETTDENWRHAQLVHSEFKTKPGSECISTEFSLAYLSAVMTRYLPRTILELGAGIGTVTKLLLTHPHRPDCIVVTEDNEYCISAFKNNLTNYESEGVLLVTDLAELIAQDLQYDLIICDGGFEDKNQFKGLSEHTIFFFEGSRGPHRRLLRQHLDEIGLMYVENNYVQKGYKFYFAKNPYHFLGISIPKPKMKRKKGCWIGRAVADQI